MTELYGRQQSVRDRICYVCMKPIPEGDGTYHAGYGILTHQGKCTDMVHKYSRDYSRSKRGSWRPVKEVLASVHRLLA